jgi:hypothetical protein
MQRKELNKMATIKTSDLKGAALDYAVALCEGGIPKIVNDKPAFSFIDEGGGYYDYLANLKYSSDWSEGGPIIEREIITLDGRGKCEWSARIWSDNRNDFIEVKHCQTALIAAMRCYVASVIGDEVEIPDELLEAMR